MIAADLSRASQVLVDLGLGYLSLNRRTPTVSPGELQRLRLATQLRAGLVRRRSTCSTSRRPACTRPTPSRCSTCSTGSGGRATRSSSSSTTWTWSAARTGSSTSDPARASSAVEVLYSGPVAGPRRRRGVGHPSVPVRRPGRAPLASRATPSRALRLRGICFHNLRDLDVDIPLGVFTAVTGVSGSGKSTLVSKVLGDVVKRHLGAGRAETGRADADDADAEIVDLDHDASIGVTRRRRRGDRPAGRRRPEARSAAPRGRRSPPTPACSTRCARVFAATDEARRRGWTAGRFSFNVADGRCPTCQGEGFVVGRVAVPARHLRARARRATARATPTRRSRCATATARSPTCSR